MLNSFFSLGPSSQRSCTVTTVTADYYRLYSTFVWRNLSLIAHSLRQSQSSLPALHSPDAQTHVTSLNQRPKCSLPLADFHRTEKCSAHYVKTSYTEFHTIRTINVESTHSNLFMAFSRVIFTLPIFMKLLITQCDSVHIYVLNFIQNG